MRDGLFHPATGLPKTLLQAVGEGKLCQEVWDAVVQRCGRQAHRAERAETRAMKAKSRKAVLEAETVLLEPVESAVRLQRVWRLVRGSRASAKLDAVFEGDRLDGRRVECDGDDFARVTGEIGE